MKDKVSADCANPTVDSENVVMEINEEPASACKVKLYDSGRIHHISFYHKHFENLVDIPNTLFTAANC